MKIEEIKNKTKQSFVDHKKTWITALVIIVCLLIITGFMIHRKNVRKNNQEMGGEQLVECALGDKFSIKTGEPCPEKTEEVVSEDTVETTDETDLSTAPATAYELARQEYKDKVLSYNDMCQATPAELVTTPDSVVMIANDSTKTHTFTLAGKTTSLVSYHYDLIYIGTPQAYKVTCDGTDAGIVTAK